MQLLALLLKLAYPKFIAALIDKRSFLLFKPSMNSLYSKMKLVYIVSNNSTQLKNKLIILVGDELLK